MSEQPTSQEAPQPNNGRMSRRKFLRNLGIGTGALTVGLVIGFPTLLREGQLAVAQAVLSGEAAPPPQMPESPFVWIRIEPDNTTHLYLPKIEMGQGIHTTLAQIAAEDLELDWEHIHTHTADTDIGFAAFTSFTFGSSSTKTLLQPVREIAATLRVMLVDEAATQLGVPASDLTAQNSRVVITDDPDTALTYGEIVAARQGEWVLPEEITPLKPSEDFQFIGKPIKRVDFREKVTGRAVYGFDARVEGMAYGAVARPPRYEAQLVRAAPGDAESQLGVIAVVIQDGFAGVVAETRLQAYAALTHLDLTWEGGTDWSEPDLEAAMFVPEDGGTLVQRVGDYNRATQDATGLFEREYSTPLASHAQLEPQSALADVRDDGVTVYASTQAPITTRDFVARAIGIAADVVNVQPMYIGGGFGRKTGINATVEAAILSQASGRPVHIGWDRTEEMRFGYHRPPTRQRLRALLGNGRIVAARHDIASGDISFGTGTVPFESIVAPLLGADPLALSNLAYDIPHRRTIYHRKNLPIPTGSWRGLGVFPNTFAIETFIDELAHEAETDPLDMRLTHTSDDPFGERMRGVLEAVAEASGWREGAPDGQSFGIAVGQLTETHIALVAAVSVDGDRFRVEQVWCAVDPGLVVNPDGARAQVEGTIVMALSSVLYEQLTIRDGLIEASNFGQYPLMTIRDVPEIETIFVETPDTPVGGLGEAVIGVVPAAVGNALFAATGQRLRQVPFRLG